jgi:hypothetical protein
MYRMLILSNPSSTVQQMLKTVHRHLLPTVTDMVTVHVPTKSAYTVLCTWNIYPAVEVLHHFQCYKKI